MAEQVEKTMKTEHRTRSELVREALRIYISIRHFPEETPTPAELRAIRRGRTAYENGDYITLHELRTKEKMARGPRVRRSGRFTSEEIHRALFPKGAPRRKKLEDLKEGIRRHIRERHARH